MKVHYRIIDDGIEIVRCFGADPEIMIPEVIDGRTVKRMAPYAFSVRKDREDEDVLVFTTDEDRMFRDEERKTVCSVTRNSFWPVSWWRA